MKTNDLSKVPPYGRANAVFVGATRYSGGPGRETAVVTMAFPPSRAPEGLAVPPRA